MSKQLFYAGQPGGVPATIISAAKVSRTIDAACACNPTATEAKLTIYLQGGAVGVSDSVKLYDAFSVAPGETKLLPALINQCIPQNGIISASSSAALNVFISGRS